MKTPLDAREERWRRRLELADSLPAGCSVLSFTLRMPASLRLSGEYDRAGGEWFDDLRSFLERDGIAVLTYEYRVSADGPEGFCTVRGGAKAVKRLAVAFEEVHPCGDLTDVDVMDSKQSVPGRSDLGLPPRRCVVCGREALRCVTARTHSAEELREAVETITAGGRKVEAKKGSRQFVQNAPLGGFRAGAPGAKNTLDGICDYIARCATTSVLFEAAAAPKPGLVTPFSNGAHTDMDYFTFLSSAAALAPYWERFARLGASRASSDPSELLPALREEGVNAERAMFAATGGVNTHKGLIFSLGVLCAAAGVLAAQGEPLFPEACARHAGLIVRGIVERDFADAGKKPPKERTAGERLYIAEGVVGIRGEAERGFPSVIDSVLPCLRDALAEGLPFNDALVETLLLLITIVEDTNILARGGREGERLAREAACRALDLGGMHTERGREAVRRMDDLLVQHRLSPGGSADLLAVTVFLDSLANEASRRYPQKISVAM